MARQVILSAKAYADIDRIVEFNNRRNHSEAFSKNFIKTLFAQFELLKTYPSIGIKTSENETLVFVYDEFYIFYALNALGDIEVSSIYHQKENISR